MASIKQRLAKALEKEFIEGTVFRIDLDRVDVAPDGSPGILRSLPLTGDRDKVKPGDRVRVINVAGERVALVGDTALSDAVEEIPEDAGEVEVAERMAQRSEDSGRIDRLSELEDVDLQTAEPADQNVLAYDAESGKWIPQVGGGGGNADTVDGMHAAAFVPNEIMSTTTSIAAKQGYDSTALFKTNVGSIAAAIGFLRTGVYGAYLGIDTDNQWKVGGWSMGANAYKLWHEGNDGAGTGLHADILDGYHASGFALNNHEHTPIFLEAYQSNTLTVPSGSWTTFAWTNIRYNSGGFGSGSGGFTAPVTGYYVCSFAVNPGFTGSFSMSLQEGLTVHKSVMSYNIAAGHYFATLTGMVYLGAGANIRPMLYHTQGTNRTFAFAWDYGNFFRIAKVG